MAAQNTSLHPYCLQANEGEAVWFLNSRLTLKATGKSTGGALSLIEALLAPGSEAALGLAHLRVDHLAHLVAAKEIVPHGGACPPAVFFAHFSQQSVSQDLGERRQGLLFFQIGDAAEHLKGGSLPQDSTAPGQRAFHRRELLQLGQDEPLHGGRQLDDLVDLSQSAQVGFSPNQGETGEW